MRNVAPAIAAAFLATTALAGLNPALAVDQTFETEKGRVQVTTFADGLANPWGLAFLPDGGMLVTEKRGNLRHVSADGTVSDPIRGIPQVDSRGQGGLLDVALDPQFAQNRLVYFSFSEPGDGGNSTAVARGVLSPDAGSLSEVQVVFSQKPKLPSTKHFGSRLVFDGQGYLFIGLGERSEEQFRTQAQDLDSHLGKVIRIRPTVRFPRTTRSSTGRAPCRRSGLTATATSRAPRCIRKPGCSGSTSTDPRAATRSTSRRRARTTAGR